MSSLNGDKARFYRINKSRALRRERMRELRKKLLAELALAAPKSDAVQVRHDEDNPVTL
jgi:hypothetical protein